MTILIFGASGCAGAEIKSVLADKGHTVFGTYHRSLPIYEDDTTMLSYEAVRTQKPIPTYKNLFMNYTTNHQIAEWLAYIIENDLKGIFHIGTKDMEDYSVFEKELLEALAFGEPAFDIHEEDEPFYQAVLPGREEIPESLQMTVKDVIRYLAEKQEDVT